MAWRKIVLLIVPGILCAQDTRVVAEPRIPPACMTLRADLTSAHGTLAEPDETRLDTARIQEAIDHCDAGHSVLLQPDPTHNAFLSGPLELRAGIALVVEEGAVLFASRDPRLYDRHPGICGTIDSNGHGCKALINGDGVAGASVMGGGIIDGRGGQKILGQSISWWDLAEQARTRGNQNCPRIMILNRCDQFTLYGITLKNSPNFHVSYSRGNGFTAWGVKLWSPGKGARNTDGIDPGDSTNVLVTRCFIHTGDDNIAIKAPPGSPTAHITIAHNHFYTGHGMSIGSETNGGASAIRVSDLSIDGADNGIRIKSNSSRGGLVSDVIYDDICVRNTKNPILMDSNYSYYGKDRDQPPWFRDITLRNVFIEGPGTITLDGYDERHRLGIQFDNVNIDGSAVGIQAAHADITIGPGGLNLVKPDNGRCPEKFVPFPKLPEY